MHLKLRRSQRAGGVLGGKILFALDARVDLSPEERMLVQKYSLGKTVLYNSEARIRHAEAVQARSLAAQSSSAGWGVYHLARGLGSLAAGTLSLQVTVDSLISGQHIECKDLDELLGAETAIREACENIKAYLEVASTFDGREEVVEI